MCNTLVAKSSGLNPVRIPTTGIGWKLFLNSPDLSSLIDGFGYVKDPDGWVSWRWTKNEGFCFFLKQEDAERARDIWNSKYWSCVLRKIEYEKGLQERDEKGFLANSTWRVALCKRFRVVEEK